MSLIDTICLGRMASALELAALGPASLLLTFRCVWRWLLPTCCHQQACLAVCPSGMACQLATAHTPAWSPSTTPPCSNYILFALSVGTVSLIAERLKQQDTEGAGRTLSGSLFLAAMGGEHHGAAGSPDALDACRAMLRHAAACWAALAGHQPGGTCSCRSWLLRQPLLSPCTQAPCLCHPTPAGLSMGLLFLQFGPQLLRLTGADPAVLVYAATYLRIRALALPAVITVQARPRGWQQCSGRWRGVDALLQCCDATLLTLQHCCAPLPQVAQAGLLAQRDSLSPFRVVLATSCASLAGDLLFIGRLGLGVAGAAWTTVLAQYLGAVLLLRSLRRSAVRPRLLVPSGSELRALMDTFGVLTIFYACKNFSYLMLQVCEGRWEWEGRWE